MLKIQGLPRVSKLKGLKSFDGQVSRSSGVSFYL